MYILCSHYVAYMLVSVELKCKWESHHMLCSRLIDYSVLCMSEKAIASKEVITALQILLSSLVASAYLLVQMDQWIPSLLVVLVALEVLCVMYGCACECICVCVCMHVCACVCMCVHVCACVCACVCMYVVELLLHHIVTHCQQYSSRRTNKS